MGPDGRSGLDLALHEISDGSHSRALRPCLVQRDGIAAFVGSFSACTAPRPASQSSLNSRVALYAQCLCMRILTCR